jgi:hypothetical protein
VKYLQYIEEKFIKHWLETREIIFYRGYVNDILIIFDTTKTNEHTIQTSIDLIHPLLHFTPTTEVDNITLRKTCIPFTFHSPLRHKVTNFFRRTPLHIIFRPTNTVFCQLRRPHYTYTRLDNSGVYRLVAMCNLPQGLRRPIWTLSPPGTENTRDTSGLIPLIQLMPYTYSTLDKNMAPRETLCTCLKLVTREI